MSNDLVPVPVEEPVDDDCLKADSLNTYDDRLNAARALQKGDEAGLRTILSRAAEIGITETEAEMLIEALHQALKIGTKTIKGAWKKLWEKAAEVRTKKAAEEAQRHANEYAARAKQAKDAERARLWASCSAIAESPIILDAMAAIAHERGLVNEDAGVRGVYLTYTSRLLAGSAIRLLRLGASASGKNIPVELTLAFLPPHAVEQFSGTSPKTLAYFGRDDPDALKHKIIYIPEAIILVGKQRQGEGDNEFATMFRTLISEGKLVYRTVMKDSDGEYETVTIVKNGPIAAILTTAKDVDQELKTRALIQETDESGAQTEAIVERVLDEHEETDNLQSWVDLQLWLELDAPYRVRIPFRKAIFKAFKQWRPDFLRASAMRMRRDVSSFLTAVEASAVLHKAQRGDLDEKGRIVATLDDYRHAYDAFDLGLAATHGGASEKVIAVVAAIEEMCGDADLPVKVTLRELAKKLRIVNLRTANDRLMEAISCEAVEQDDSMSGRGGARYFRLLTTANDLRKAPSLGVFPPPDLVRENYIQSQSSENKDTNATKDTKGAKTRI
jgi:hypothetical protein